MAAGKLLLHSSSNLVRYSVKKDGIIILILLSLMEEALRHLHSYQTQEGKSPEEQKAMVSASRIACYNRGQIRACVKCGKVILMYWHRECPRRYICGQGNEHNTSSHRMGKQAGAVPRRCENGL